MNKFLIKNNGFTLIEFIISQFLCLLIIAALINLFLWCKSQQEEIYQFHKIINTQRFLRYYFNRQVSHSGIIGCGKSSETISIQNHTEYSIDLKHALSIFTDANNNNILQIWFAAEKGEPIKLMPSKNEIIMQQKTRFKPKEVIMISDCNNAEIAIVQNIQNNLISLEKPLTKIFVEPAQVYHFKYDQYFIKNTKRKNQQKIYLMALYKKSINTAPNELIEGVESMQLNIRKTSLGSLIYFKFKLTTNLKKLINENYNLILSTS